MLWGYDINVNLISDVASSLPLGLSHKRTIVFLSVLQNFGGSAQMRTQFALRTECVARHIPLDLLDELGRLRFQLWIN